MVTQKELLTEHRKGLDKEFETKYPNGIFTLQKFDRGMGYLAIHWCRKRNTGWTSHPGVTVKYINKYERDKYYGLQVSEYKDTWIVENADHQNNSFGKTYRYDSLDKMLKGTEKLTFPEVLVCAFLERYNEMLKTKILKVQTKWNDDTRKWETRKLDYKTYEVIK